jgi:hypothetical protein
MRGKSKPEWYARHIFICFLFPFKTSPLTNTTQARSTINHSLHNLDLALERGQNRTSTTQSESPTAGLELRLRSLAQSVSSSAPGSQGGILGQIKSFNAQLEAAARRLEG